MYVSSIYRYGASIIYNLICTLATQVQIHNNINIFNIGLIKKRKNRIHDDKKYTMRDFARKRKN